MTTEVARPTTDQPGSDNLGHCAVAPTPRALRTMAVVRWALLALVTLAASYTVWTFWGPGESASKGAREEARYHCPMHPQIRSPDPGQCPICHMNLELIPAERLEGRAPTKAEPAGPGATRAVASHPSDVTGVTLSEEQQRSVGLRTSEVERASLGDHLRVPGVISAPETGLAEVRVRAAGFVEQVSVRQTGVRVTRGQPLAFIYSPEIYRAQEEFLAALRWNAGAAGTTSSPTGTPDILVAARRGLELLGLDTADIDEIARTGRPMRAIPVRATAGGFVTRFNAVLGSRADPERVLYEIADLSSVWVIASVHERDVKSLRVGSSARFRLSETSDAALTGRIDLIEPTLEESTRTTRVRLVVRNAKGALRPGQFGDVEFELPTADGLFVPHDAVIRTGEHDYVYAATGPHRFEPQRVRTGITREGRVQILEGVGQGDRVVTRGSFMLDSESRLQASLAAAPPLASSSRAASPEPR